MALVTLDPGEEVEVEFNMLPPKVGLPSRCEATVNGWISINDHDAWGDNPLDALVFPCNDLDNAPAIFAAYIKQYRERSDS